VQIEKLFCLNVSDCVYWTTVLSFEVPNFNSNFGFVVEEILELGHISFSDSASTLIE